MFNPDTFEVFDEVTVPRKKKRNRIKNQDVSHNTGLHLKSILPLTDTQQEFFDSFDEFDNHILIGSAGTGKTFLSIYFSLREILLKNQQNKLLIIRSAASSRDIGFLPGNKTEKMKAFESPYYGIFTDLFGRGDAYDVLKNRKIVEFEPTSFMRGTTFNDTIIVVDEAQNLTWQELNTIATRCGKNSRLILAGDTKQCDLNGRKDGVSGLDKFLNVAPLIKSVYTTIFNRDDIVRSGFVKEFIIACEKKGY